MNYRQLLHLSLLFGVGVGPQTPDLYGATLPPGVALDSKPYLRIDLEGPPISLDPHCNESAEAASVIRDLFEGLVITDEQGEVVPGTASHWEQSNELTWTFHIRPTACWSNGDPVTAGDFVYSWKRLSAQKSRHAKELYLLLNLKEAKAVLEGTKPPEALGIEALDERTLVLHLEKPTPALLQRLCSAIFVPLHRASVERQMQQPYHEWSWIIGNGAYCAPVGFKKERIRIVRNRYYWDNAKTCIPIVEYIFQSTILCKKTKAERFATGEVDITGVWGEKESYLALKEIFPNDTKTFQTLGWQGLWLNTKNPDLAAPALRNALNLVIDREAFLRSTKNQGDQSTYGILPPSDGRTPTAPEWSTLPYRERCREARRLVRSLPPSQRSPKLVLLYTQRGRSDQQVRYLTEVWRKELGISVNLQPLSREGVVQYLRIPNAHLGTANFSLQSDDPIAALSLFLAESDQNVSRYDSEAYRHCWQRACEASTAGDRWRYCQEANLLLAKDVPCIPLTFAARSYLINPKLRGYNLANPLGIFYAKDLYFIQ